ncbi:ABC transporter substrate-binding protein [Chloroflexota bacterium]
MTFIKAQKTFVVIAIVVVIGVLVSGCQEKPEKPEQFEKVTLGVESGLLSASVWVAENKGYFEEEGLDLTIEEFDSGKSSFFAMLEGKGIDISTVAPTPIMFSSFDRQDFYIFATFAYAYEDIKVIAHRGKGITATADLKGKKIGTPAGTTGQFVTETFLIHNGLSSSDVEVIDIGSSELPDALNNHRVDAIVIWEPHAYNAQNLLGQDAVRLPSSDIYRTTFNFMIMKDFAQAHPEALIKFLRAIDRATEFIAKYEEESQDIVAERLKLDKEVMAVLWDDVIMEIFLDQSLLVTTEAEARWAIKNKLTDKTEVPNYLDYIYYDALEEVKPEAVGIIR